MRIQQRGPMTPNSSLKIRSSKITFS
jgi:hypothetical protein